MVSPMVTYMLLLYKLVWEVDRERSVAIVRVIKNPVKYLKGKYNDPNLAYEEVEELADRLVVRELHAGN